MVSRAYQVSVYKRSNDDPTLCWLGRHRVHKIHVHAIYEQSDLSNIEKRFSRDVDDTCAGGIGFPFIMSTVDSNLKVIETLQLCNIPKSGACT